MTSLALVGLYPETPTTDCSNKLMVTVITFLLSSGRGSVEANISKSGGSAIGFTGAQLWVSVIRQQEDKTVRGASFAKTISLRDFVKIVTYEATARHNLKAIILLAAFAETGLERILEDAFAGRSVDFILEKIVHYSKWTYEELEEVLQYNREEVRSLYAWGSGELSGRNNPSL